ncbi:uncharacterized protein [Coffea arabica]|uniref:Reverse transcriptase zinc-binding domain-containing protein n=1 Tax=Coffea arabica TaxID=13443 RepID=A0ABM4W2X6_COFAR
MVSDFVEQGCWNVQRLGMVAPSGWVGRILGVVPPSLDQADTMVWAPSISGVFSLASAYRVAHEGGNSSWLYSQLWLQELPIKISFFMLRLIGSRLLVMDRLHKLGIVGPSRCGCCLYPGQESLDHIFCTGEAAKRIWGYFEGVVGGFQESFTVRHKLVSWWLRPTRNPYLQYLFRLLPSLICWHLWKMWNSFVFDGHHTPMVHVCSAIFGISGIFSTLNLNAWLSLFMIGRVGTGWWLACRGWSGPWLCGGAAQRTISSN